MPDYKNLSYKVIWSEEDEGYIGLCKEFPNLSYLATTEKKALKGIEELAQDVLKDMDQILDNGF
ncbi:MULTISPECIES: hypothetical protein [Zooshikella]|uniref:Type II toxin-antitoxin system HicB family antitoxin n=1 Tax=Zooshikella harenae TaxID=2827238 RepID=A0ABS5ZKG2_9GAMM|nr:hypothetical protein [Zooshikella harenae]MBU2714318.1 hypothetical protein [Zooshikella harenae]